MKAANRRPLEAIALYLNLERPRAAETARRVNELAAGLGVRVALCDGGGAPFGVVPTCELADAQLLVSVGGDGTLLRAARLAHPRRLPIVGINTGRLGFLTEVEADEEGFAALRQLFEGRFAIDERIALHARVQGRDEVHFALNDVVMQTHNTGRTLDFETRIDGRYVNTHDGDGVIVASPTGSTAYALSCSGPIIEPHLSALVIVPICAHTLSDRPIVVAATSVVEVLLLERPDTRANVTCDGMVLGALAPGERLDVTTAPERVTLLHPPGHDYYKLLRSKLHWGRGSFER